MFSGGDSSGDGVNSRNQFNWQMTSQTSCNVNSGGSIDWASLAQQWIQMKDSGAGIPETPPPPVISHNYSMKSIKTTKFDEQGEADMEVEKDDEVQNIEFGQDSPPPPPPGRWIPISLQQQDAAAYCPPQQNWGWPTRVTLPPPILHVPITTGSLTPPIPKEILNATTNLPKQVTEASSMLPGKGHLDQLPMDAAKRKILPAWIREGLEKMEREKLKQLDRDKDSFSAGTAAAHEDDINNFKTMVKSSITEMEGDESSGNEEEANDTAEHRDDTDADSVLAPTAYVPTSVLPERIHNSGKTYEEKVADMMIGVRKTLTELLLEVTNEEILSIANEAIRKRRAKASSVQVIRKSAIPSITGKLGLEAYADSDTENSASDNDTTNDEGKRSDDDYDSEEELKANIRIRQRAFLKTIEEIEDTIEATAVREDLLLKEHRREETKSEVTPSEPTKRGRSPLQNKAIGFEKEIGEPLQPDKKSNSNGKKRKERTSRFSDNKDSRNRMTASFYQPPSMGSGSLPTQTMPGASAAATLTPLSTASAGKYKPSAVSAASINLPSSNDKRSGSSSANKSSKQSTSSSSTRHHHNNSNSSTSSSDSSSSSSSSSHSRRSKYSNSRHKRSSTERSKRSHRSRSHRSTSHRSSRRRDSSDSNDDDSYKKRSSRHHSHKSHSSSAYSRRHDRRRRSDSKSSRSRTRSRSRSRSTTYSSSRRNDRC